MVIWNYGADKIREEWNLEKLSNYNKLKSLETEQIGEDVYIRIRPTVGYNYISILSNFESKCININLIRGVEIDDYFQGIIIDSFSKEIINNYLRYLSEKNVYASDKTLFDKRIVTNIY